MHPKHKVFTLEEAQALLPELTRRLNLLYGKKEEYDRKHDHILMEQLLVETESGHSMPVQASGLEQEIQSMEHQITELTQDLAEIRKLGCVLRNLEQGWVDFLAQRDGEWVYYSWKRGDKTIRYYRRADQEPHLRTPLD